MASSWVTSCLQVTRSQSVQPSGRAILELKFSFFLSHCSVAQHGKGVPLPLWEMPLWGSVRTEAHQIELLWQAWSRLAVKSLNKSDLPHATCALGCHCASSVRLVPPLRTFLQHTSGRTCCRDSGAAAVLSGSSSEGKRRNKQSLLTLRSLCQCRPRRSLGSVPATQAGPTAEAV